MNAKTQLDLHGLFADLPENDEPDVSPARRQPGRSITCC